MAEGMNDLSNKDVDPPGRVNSISTLT